MKLLFIAVVAMASLSAHAVSFSPIARQANGEPVRLNSLSKAKEFCETQGARLPTAREYAALAATRGAKGIRELPVGATWDDAVMLNGKDGYFMITFLNDLGITEVDFFYSHEGYQMVEEEYSGPLRLLPGLWTASGRPLDERKNPKGWSVIFQPRNGSLMRMETAFFGSFGVRCVR